MSRTADVFIDGFDGPLSEREFLRRVVPGAIINVIVSPTGVRDSRDVGCFKFARVLGVTQRPDWPAAECPRCRETSVRYAIEVEWEAEYESPDGSVLCEHGVDGIVTHGQELIPLGHETWGTKTLQISRRIRR